MKLLRRATTKENSNMLQAAFYLVFSLILSVFINQDPFNRFRVPRMGVFLLILVVIAAISRLNCKDFDNSLWLTHIKEPCRLKCYLLYAVSIFLALFFDAYIHYISQFAGYEEPNDYNVAVGKFVALISVIVILLVYEISRGQFSAECMEWWMIFNAFLLRIVYVINTGIDNAWSNDVGGYSAESTGHLAYINTILETGRFPTNPANGWEYPQPPLWHILCAGWAKINMLVFDKDRAFENLQYLSVFVSVATIIAVYGILKKLQVKPANRILVLGVVGFMPHFVLMSGNLNNDGLVTLFEVLLVLLTIKYYEDNTFKSIVLLAVCFGLAMMAKLSAAVYAFPIGIVMIYIFVCDIKTKSFKTAFVDRICKHYIPFGMISGVLSLWWSIRLKVMYDLPFGYFQPMIGGEQYLGDYALTQRLFGTSHQLDQFNICRFNNQQNTDYNVFIMYIKYSIFGETYGAAGNGVVTLLGGVAFALLVCIYVGAFWYLLKALWRKKFKLSIMDVFMLLSAFVPIATLFIRALAPKTAQSCNMNIRFALAGIMMLFVCAARAMSDIEAVRTTERGNADGDSNSCTIADKLVWSFAVVSVLLITIMLTI